MRVEGLDEGGAEEADGVGICAGAYVDCDAGEDDQKRSALARPDARTYLSQIFQSLSERLIALALR